MQNTSDSFLIHIESMCRSLATHHHILVHYMEYILFQLRSMAPLWSTTVGPAGGECTHLRDLMVNLGKEGTWRCLAVWKMLLIQLTSSPPIAPSLTVKWSSLGSSQNEVKSISTNLQWTRDIGWLLNDAYHTLVTGTTNAGRFKRVLWCFGCSGEMVRFWTWVLCKT